MNSEGSADNLSRQDRRRNMQAIRSKRTAMENKVCNALWAQGIRYRRNVRDLPGKPDLALKRAKVAVFLDSCFWHGCPEHGNIPKNHAEYWVPKLERNKARDEEVNRQYEALGWTVLRVWEHQIKQDFDAVIAKISRALKS